MVRPRKEQQLDIPTLAIEHSIRLLNSKDARSLTLSEVASAVGCRPPALYAYFANKDALLRAVHDEGFRILMQDKLRLATEYADNSLERLRAGGQAYVHFAFSYPGLYQLMFSPPPAAELSDNPFASDQGKQCLTLLQQAISACQQEGYLPEQDSSTMAFVLWSSVHGAIDLALQQRAPFLTEQSAEKVALHAVEQMMHFIQQSRRLPPTTE